MPDREKVIKGLEHCSNTQNCSGCPYFCFNAKCQDDMNKDAIELLKEQQRRIEKLELEKGWDESPDMMGKW